jgi:hypothetical protein
VTSTDGWSGRFARVRTAARPRLVLFACVACAVLFLPASAAAALPSYTWTGLSTEGEGWVLPANWAEGVPELIPDTAIGTLTFPRLTCVEPILKCYSARNDVSGLSAESIKIDDGDTYHISGEPLSLGKEGLDAAPASGASGRADDFVELPLRLSAGQTWTVIGNGSEMVENRLTLGSEVTGSTNELGVDISKMALVRLVGDTEVGPVSFVGEGVKDSFAALLGGKVNAIDAHQIELSHIFFFGYGEVGPLSTSASELGVGMSEYPTQRIEAASVTLDPSSRVVFHVTGDGTAPGGDFSQLASKGSVSLDDSKVLIEAGTEKSCPLLTPGETFTFITTPGALTGEFANAPAGGTEIPLTYSKSCNGSQTMRIAYHESGGTDTVTGTVEAAAKEQQEARERQEAKERQEAAERAATVTPTPSLSVLGVNEVLPAAALASKVITVGSSGRVTVKIKCTAGEGSCSGTVVLRTLHAVAAAEGSPAVARAVLTLGSAFFNIQVGKEGSIILYLSKAGKHLIAHGHNLAALATIKVKKKPAGYVTTQASLTLRGPQPKHH